jgi:hypothetical protein
MPYFTDRRVRHNPYLFDWERFRVGVRCDEPEANADEVWWLPAVAEVCETCDGRGEYVNPAIDAHGITREDFDADPDFEEAYFSRQYNEVCETCDGRRVELVVSPLVPDEQAERFYRIADGEYAEWRDDQYTRWAESGYPA